jgi:hypothetical protein
MQTRAEQITEHFYHWEALGRGHILFEHPVSLEPTYLPYSLEKFHEQDYVDDGKVPSLFSRMFNHAKELLTSTEEDIEQETEEPEYEVADTSDASYLTGFRFAFQQGQEISPRYVTEFLSALSYTRHHLSFEIVATSREIIIQLVGTAFDVDKAQRHLQVFFPGVIVETIDDPLDLPFSYDEHREIAIADMAPAEEYMRGFEHVRDFSLDSLTSIFTTLEHLREDEVAMIQVMFAGVKNPWKYDMLRSVSDGQGGSFFKGSTEMLSCTEDKVSQPLFSCVVRLAAQSAFTERSEALTYELAHQLTKATESPYNRLVLLSNEGYEYNQHVTNLFFRKSNRWGFFLNSHELAQLIHYPNNLVSNKLGFKGAPSKELPVYLKTGMYNIGVNIHQGKQQEVFLSDEMRLRHTHIIGATGVGKSTLIARMISEDIKAGNGCALFDPHGDIVEEVIAQIPPERTPDVTLIDPSDTDYPIGFNLLQAESEAEKIVLSSDLVSAFAEHATAWGDQMTSVLSNAINAFLYSTKGGTLIELKRFLLEKPFREKFLESIDDPSILYYWEHDFPMLRSGSLSPLITRIDTFLRPTIVRYMLAQKSGVDFNKALQQKKIVLIKLSQGLIGEENSYLLASLFLAKLLQSAQRRQSLPKEERHPYYVYLDEFQHFLTPSITSILSGARKYGLGLILAHQELAQIDKPKILGSVISNPYIRICFRLGDTDAKKLEGNFSSFSAGDLQSLSRGEAIMKVGGASNDFNLLGYSPYISDPEVYEKQRKDIVAKTREQYGTPKEEVERIIENLLPKRDSKDKVGSQPVTNTSARSEHQEPEVKGEVAPNTEDEVSAPDEAFDFKAVMQEQEEAKEHQKIQRDIKKGAQELGFLATIEKGIEGARRIDVMLERADLTVAVEVSVSNTIDYEIENIRKCLSHASHIVMTSPNETHLKNIKFKAKEAFEKSIFKRLHFLKPDEVKEFLQSFTPPKKKPQEKIVNGYRVKVTESKTDPKSLANKMSELVRVLGRSKGKA